MPRSMPLRRSPADRLWFVCSAAEDSSCGSTVDRETTKSPIRGQGGWSLHGCLVIFASAPTEVPLDSSPEVSPEEALDSTLDLPLDLWAVTLQARE